MKFPLSTTILVLSAAAISSATAFVPSSLTFAKSGVTSIATAEITTSPTNYYGVSSTRLGVSIPEAKGLLKDIEKFGDFDPDDEDDDDDEKSQKLLDVTIKALEVLDGERSSVSDDVIMSEVAADQVSVSRRPVLTEYSDEGEEAEKGEFEEGKAGSNAIFGGALSILRALRKQGVKRSTIGFTTYPRHPEYPDVDLSGAMKMMDGAPPLNQIFNAKKLVRLIRRALQTLIAYDRLGGRDAAANAETKEAAYQTAFTKSQLLGIFPNPLDVLPLPKHTVEHWEEDKEVARQFLCGTNPVMVNVAKEIGQLSDNIVDYFGNDKLQDLVDEKRLFFVSYDDLADLEVNPHQAYPLPKNKDKPQDQPRYCYAPIIAFVLGEDRKELDILGIQLERTPDAPIYTRDNSGVNEWLFVKSCVTTADSNIHEWCSHLGDTHLTMEPHIIAIYNILRKEKHDLYTFLKPLCKDTLLLNWAARRTLAGFGEGAFGDKQSSIGVGQFMQVIGKRWSRYSFFEKSSLPSELASRGFDEDIDMPGYLYREDGMKLWNAYGEFAKDFVDEVYDSDDDVASDKIVQEWAIETTDASKGAVPGFPTSFKDKATLVKVLQTLMWIPSGLHAAVNMPQYDFYAYVPNKPLGMRADLKALPNDDAEIRSWMFENHFPHVSGEYETALTAAQTVHLLTLPSNTCIDNLSRQFDGVGEESYTKFVENLDKIGDVIEDRNKESKNSGKAVYSYLNPSVVPASIDI
eukprot:CAMPEP_0172300922 /NCGR_PEP_ID=MMETSP1058-20130122/2916_1 /TAXON_ID=83371 /ORGANISM="Detonula confervacea, Strain CCMP 353" /LENGTH=743 /DNA_ID=CAMNT_0013010869 /DNA_START=154 /DNA_END=2385 /DNA_ORIENTATION=+